MIFNSLTYVVFLSVTVCAYWVLPRQPRLLMLFLASILFYGFWRFDFVPLLLASVITDYFAARIIHGTEKQRVRKLALVFSLSVNLLLLGFFKYFYFFAENTQQLGAVFGLSLDVPAWTILLPIGISFYTFQSMSYTIDVYRRVTEPSRDFILFANYVIFFPQLVAGPILRASEILWQLDKRPEFRASDITAGIQRILGGLFLKVVLADNLAIFVDAGFALDPSTLSAIDVITLAFLFGFQIYFDFAGYSHIALGSARLMGIRFPENFNFPYSAASPREFWQRWHISLSSWIRDYLYVPLTATRFESKSTGGLGTASKMPVTNARAMTALFATWAIMGLWHGANWTFVVWGLWHAGFIAFHRLVSTTTDRFPEIVRRHGGWAWTIVMMMLSWIPFRAESLKDTLTMWSHLINPADWSHLGLRENNYVVAALVMIGLLVMPRLLALWQNYALQPQPFAKPLQFAAMTAMFAIVLIYLRPIDQFIYFQF